MSQTTHKPRGFVQAVACLLIISCVLLLPNSGAAFQESEVKLAEGTEFDVFTIDEISSKTATEGDPLTFKVADDVKVGNVVVIAKDAMVKGTVSSAEKSGHMGKSGKLGIRVESTSAVDGQKVRLRATKGKQGDDKTGSVIALTLLVSPLFLLKHGKDAKIKSGTRLKVFVDEEIKVKPNI